MTADLTASAHCLDALTSMTLPLDKLRLPENGESLNARKREPDISAMKRSLLNYGLIMPLVVSRAEDGVHSIIIGGTRYRAMCSLAKEGLWDGPVSCLVAPAMASRADLLELSMAENLDRQDLHPVDVFEVYNSLVEDGIPIDAIAKKRGQSIKVVRQALALGAMAPQVREAWRAGKLSAEAAEAFAVVPSHEAQAAALKKAGASPSSYTVKRTLLGDRHQAPADLVKFVGRAVYEKAGGQVNPSLFADGETVSDYALLAGMARKKLSDQCDALTEEGWKWALIADEAPPDVNSWKREQPANGNAFTKAERAELGCFVNNQGYVSMTVVTGFRRPGDKPAAAAPKTAKEKKAAQKAKAEKKEATGGLSNALAQRLSRQLTCAVRDALETAKPDVVITLAIAALACETAPTKIRFDVSHDLYTERANDFAKYVRLAHGKDVRSRARVLAIWLGASIDLTCLSAESLIGLMSGEADKGATAALMKMLSPAAYNAAAAKHFDREDYFRSVSKETVVDDVRDSLGAAHADRIAKLSKDEAAEYAIEHVKKGWVPAALRYPK